MKKGVRETEDENKREQRLVLTVLLLQLIDHLLSIVEKLTK